MGTAVKDVGRFAVNPLWGVQQIASREIDKMTDIDTPEPPKSPNLPEAAQGAADRQRKKAQAAYSRSDTILTSPLGLPGAVGGDKKTLLGR